MNYQQPPPAYIHQVPNTSTFTSSDSNGNVTMIVPSAKGTWVVIPPFKAFPEPQINPNPPPMFDDGDEEDSDGSDQ